MSHKPKDLDRCEFIFPSGHRCRQLRTHPGASFCLNHRRRQHQQEESARIGDEIVGADGALNTEEGIHKALTNVFANLARNRISARDASVLAYVGQLMLVSRPSVERTIKSMLPMLQLSFRIGQRDKDANIKSSREVLKNALLEQEIFRGLLTQSESYRQMTPQDLLSMLQFASLFTGKPITPPAAPPQQKPGASPPETPGAAPPLKKSA